MIEQALEKLFDQYMRAFSRYDIQLINDCYQLPCTLSTPEKMLVILDEQTFETEFDKIFLQLQSASIAGLTASNASYICATNELILASVDWAFIDDNENIFADFMALYHIVKTDHKYKIVSVSSHELSHEKQFPNTFLVK